MEIGINFPMLVPGVDRRTILEWAARAEAGPFCALGGGLGKRGSFVGPGPSNFGSLDRLQLFCLALFLG